MMKGLVCSTAAIVLMGILVLNPSVGNPGNGQAGACGALALAQDGASEQAQECTWLVILNCFGPSRSRSFSSGGLTGSALASYAVGAGPGVKPWEFQCYGSASAYDRGFPYEAQCQGAVTGYLTITAYNLSAATCPGAAAYSAHMEINGCVRLMDTDCAAAALGYVEVKSNMGPHAYAKLDSSAAETKEQQLGSLGAAFRGLGVSIPVSVGVGLGEYPDQDANRALGLACVDYFTLKTRARSFVKAWANATLLSARCNCEMSGGIDLSCWLGCCGD